MVPQAGDLVWRNKDPALDAQARASYESLSSTEMRKVPVDATVAGSIGQVWRLCAILPEPCQPLCSAVLVLVNCCDAGSLGTVNLVGSAVCLDSQCCYEICASSWGKVVLQALRLTLFVDGELAAEADSAVALQAASSVPLSESALRKALGALGSNSLSLRSLDLSRLELSAGKRH